jgi:hypothetical protein
MGMKNTSSSRDYGPGELARRFTVVPKLSLSNGYCGKVVDDTEIDRLLFHDRINATQHSILVAFLRVLKDASFIGLKSPDFNAISAPDPVGIADRKAKAVFKVVGIIRALDQKAGRAIRCALIDLIISDRPWPDGLSLDHGILALQDIFANRQRKFKGEQPRHDPVPVGMDTNL